MYRHNSLISSGSSSKPSTGRIFRHHSPTSSVPIFRRQSPSVPYRRRSPSPNLTKCHHQEESSSASYTMRPSSSSSHAQFQIIRKDLYPPPYMVWSQPSAANSVENPSSSSCSNCSVTLSAVVVVAEKPIDNQALPEKSLLLSKSDAVSTKRNKPTVQQESSEQPSSGFVPSSDYSLNSIMPPPIELIPPAAPMKSSSTSVVKEETDKLPSSQPPAMPQQQQKPPPPKKQGFSIEEIMRR